MARACIFAPGDTWPILVRGERRDEGEGALALAPTPAPASSWPSYASDFFAGGVAGSEPAGEREARSGTADEPRATLPRADLGDLGGLLTDASGERRFLALDSSTLAAAAAASSRKRPVDMGSGSSSGSDARAFAGPRGPTDAGPVNHEPSGVLYAPPPAKSGVIIPPGHSLLAIHESGVVTCCVPRRVPTHCGVAARGVPAGTLGGVAASGGSARLPKPRKEGVEGVALGTCAQKGGRTRGSTLGSRSVEARRVKTSRESHVSRRRAQGREGGHAPCAQTRASRPRRRSVRGVSSRTRPCRSLASRLPERRASDDGASQRGVCDEASREKLLGCSGRNGHFSDVPRRGDGAGTRTLARARRLGPRAPHGAMLASIPGRDARDGPMDLSYAAAERDSAPHLIPQGKVSNLTAKRLRAEIRARMKREASMSDERRLAAKLASARVREPVNWPAERDFTDVNRIPEPREHYFQHDAGGARARERRKSSARPR